MFRIILGVCLSVLSFSVWAQTTPPPKAEVKPLMHQFYASMESLKELASSPEKFSKKENEAEIGQKLRDLVKLGGQMKQHDGLKTPGFKLSQNTLIQHLSDLERVYRVGNKSYARWMLKSTYFACMSCHSQLPTADGMKWEMDPKSLSVAGKPSMDEADFLFATRRFDEALASYERLIDGYPGNNLKADEIDAALRKKLTIFSRIKRDPSKALLSLEKNSKNQKLPEYLRKNIDAWIAVLREWQNSPVPDTAKAKDEEIRNFAEKQLKGSLWDKMIDASDPRLVTYLQVSGVLYEYLDRNPKTKLAPQILYWLSLCDRQINNEFFFSLADLYLKDCILSYSKSPFAKQCYKELERQTFLSYTGSSGTHIPPEVKDELGRLRKKLK